jgi:integrase
VLGFEFRSHDLRRTVATRLGEAGIRREDISAVLNHIQGGPAATRVYDRYSRDREKRVALEVWARTLQDILKDRDK